MDKRGSGYLKEYILSILVCGVVYYWSVADGVLWQDNGLAQIRAYLQDFRGELGLALAHPLFYMISQVFLLLPFKDPAYKVNLVAATFGILTVANVYVFIRYILEEQPFGRFAAIIGSLSLALAHTFWQHSSMCEVYTLSTFFLTVELLCFAMFVRTQNILWFYLVWFFNGIETANHMLAVLTLAVIVVWTAVLLKQSRLRPVNIIFAIFLWILGASPYLMLALGDLLSGRGVVSVLESMFFGNSYKGKVLNTNISFKMLILSLAIIGLNFPTPNITFVPIGIVRSAKLRYIKREIYWFLLSLTAIHFLFAFRYNVRDQYTFFIITVLLCSIWLGIGAGGFAKDKLCKVAILLFTVLPVFVYSALPRIVEYFGIDFGYRAPIPYRDEARYFLLPWKSGYRGPELLVEEVFSQLPENSIIIADSTAMRPFVYYKLVYGRRPDVKIVNDLYVGLDEKTRLVFLEDLLRFRSVYVVRPYRRYCPDWILDNFELRKEGPLYKVIGPKRHNLSTDRSGPW